MTTVAITEEQVGKMVRVRLGSMLDHNTERWFSEFLMKASGVAYLEYDTQTMRLAGYGVWEPYWENFRFWLEVGLMSDPE